MNRYLTGAAAALSAHLPFGGGTRAAYPADLTAKIEDGLPETLRGMGASRRCRPHQDQARWRRPGLGLDRVLSVNAVLSELREQKDWRYSLDFNERCQDAEYVLDCFARIREGEPEAFSRIEYVEQPTNRNLDAPGTPDMHEAAKIKPW